ncbi:MAG: hypothetical protein ICV84_04230 [Flavisolibacter sp.]|nr:hypothetical protein [Flavisolibacter sp.]
MALQIVVSYRDQPVTYNVTTQENEIFYLRLQNGKKRTGSDYVPEKIIIRRKGKLWVSDTETYEELVQELTRQITMFSTENSL